MMVCEQCWDRFDEPDPERVETICRHKGTGRCPIHRATSAWRNRVTIWTRFAVWWAGAE